MLDGSRRKMFDRGRMMRSVLIWSALTGALLALPVARGQEPLAGLAQALGDGTFDLSFRYRYELVDQDGIAADANASTLRTRLTYNSAVFRDFSLLLEADDLRAVGADSYNSTRNGKTDRPAVFDPEGTDLNQAGIKYTGFTNAEIVFGRQRINRVNQRFIGGVGWRQNEQTFDALSVSYSFSDELQGFYSYVSNVNRIFGPNSGTPAGDLRGSSHLVDLSYDLGRGARVTGYSYFLDFDDTPALSNRTFGVRLVGSLSLAEDLTLPYTAEYAHQEDNGDNATDYDDHYILLEAGLNWPLFDVKLGYEVLGGSGVAGGAFVTPLATLHGFQGWADKFLSPPAGGVEDTYLTLNLRILGGNVSATYHDFSADSSGGSYGDEIDLAGSWRFADNYSVLVKLASYSSDGFATDTRKIWIMLTAAF